MKALLTITITLFFYLSFNAQIVPPYFEDFETNNSGWSHYTEDGSINDDWQRGSSMAEYSQPYSGYFAWCTNVNGDFSGGDYSLETPSFDLSDTNVEYIFSFYHRKNFPNNSWGRIYYSINDGQNWIELNTNSNDKKYSWYNDSFTGTTSSYYRPRISLDFLQGNSNVKFKFKFHGVNEGEGWVIDDFGIKVFENPDIIAVNTNAISQLPSNFSTYDITFGVQKEFEFGFPVLKNYIYYSTDSIFDPSDILIDSVTSAFNNGTIGVEITNTGFIEGGVNYLFFELDVDNDLEEINENNNLGYCALVTEPVYELPFITDFETDIEEITTYNSIADCEYWYKGNSVNQRFSNPHSGDYAWFSSLDLSCSNYLQFPFVNLQGADNIIHFFYKKELFRDIDINYSYVSNSGNVQWSVLDEIDEGGALKDWSYHITDIPVSLDSTFSIRFKTLNNGAAMIDDVYIGEKKSDLLINVMEDYRYTINNILEDTLFYELRNCGNIDAPLSTSRFYLSSDTIFDINDVLLGEKTENNLAGLQDEIRSFVYTKPNLDLGDYYIFCELDINNDVDEMREGNNHQMFWVKQQNIITAPYFTDFELNAQDWFHYSDYKTDTWIYGESESNYPEINGYAMGSNPIDDTRSLLYTPIYDLTEMSNPVLEFAMTNTINYGDWLTSASRINMNFSIDGGATWELLDTTNTSFKRWYYGVKQTPSTPEELLYNTGESTFIDDIYYTSREDDGSRNYILDINFLKEYNHVQFRFNHGVYKGREEVTVYIDDFGVMEADIDLTIDYPKDMYLSPLTEEIEFEYHLRNKGNYISEPTTLNLYLSTDSLLDASDYLIEGDIEVTSIKPDQRNWYFQLLSNFGNELAGKNYLLFDIDPNNIIEESDETNNIEFFRLKQEGIQNYPHLDDFNDYEYHGWRNYNFLDGTNSYFQEPVKFTNKDYGLSYTYEGPDGQMNLDILHNIWSIMPTVYLESPTFDMASLNDVYLSFNYSVITNQSSSISQQEGVNFQYSLDGGQNWNVLGGFNDSQGTNWYDRETCGLLDDEPGWFNCNDEYFTAVYDASTLLSGEEDVTFRYKVKSKHQCYNPGPQGLKVDNFRIAETEPEIDFVAISRGDTLNFELNYVPGHQTFNTFLTDISTTGDLIGDGAINYKWSTDTIYNENDSQVNSYSSFLGCLPNDTISVSTEIGYPFFSCDTTLYLVYKINPNISGLNSLPTVETDFTNNEGYFVVNLIDHSELVLPSQALNIDDIILCEGDQVEITILENSDHSQNISEFQWSNGSTSSSVEVTTAGEYSVVTESLYGCVTESDTVLVEVLENSVEILNDGETNFCAPDSLLLYVDQPGDITWMTGQTTDSIYATVGIDYSVELYSSNGCTAYDTVSLTINYPSMPSLSLGGDQVICNESTLISASVNHNNYFWNTGDSTRVISIDQSGEYFYSVNSACGLINSDTINVSLNNLIDSISPGNHILGCLNETVPLEVFSDNENDVSWNYQTTYNNQSIYFESFIDPNGDLYPNSVYTWWIDSSSTEVHNPEIFIENFNLVFIPDGEPVTFHTDKIDISNYFDISLEVFLNNSMDDSIFVYYIVDDQAPQLFEENGAVIGYGSQTSEGNVFEGNWLEIMIVFNGIAINNSDKQVLYDLSVRGMSKTYNTSFLADGNPVDFQLNDEDIVVVEVDNGTCIQREAISFEEYVVSYVDSPYSVCSGMDQLLSLGNLTPGYEVVWPDEPYIIENMGNEVIINLDQNQYIPITLIDSNGCEIFQNIYVNSFWYTNNIYNNSGILSSSMSNPETEYQWINCETNADVIGEQNQSFTPLNNGTYAVITTFQGCIDTSSCSTVDNIQCTSIQIKIDTDCWGNDISWNLSDTSQTILLNSNLNEYDDFTEYLTDVCLVDGCYTFEILDAGGDGLNGSINNGCEVDGNYLITNFEGDTIVEMGNPNFGFSIEHQFCLDFNLIYGCLDPEACNYDILVTNDDGSCVFDLCSGCTDPTACNYDELDTIDDGSCEFDSCAGCTDPTACNYNELDTIDDGSCEFDSCAGCTDSTACNYDELASIDDDSCEFDSCAGCTDSTACNYDELDTIDDGSCEFDSCAGCTDSTACNYDELNTIDDGSCEFESCAGCTDSLGINYDSNATIDDGSCMYSECEAIFYIYEINEEENLVTLVDSSYGTGILNYSWDFGDGNTSIENLPSHFYEEYGTYDLCLLISDEFGCQDEQCIEVTFDPNGYIIDGNFIGFSTISNGFFINVIGYDMVSIEEFELNEDLNFVFPIPADNWLFINMNINTDKNTLYTITDITGKLIRNKSILNSKINISDLSNGLYVLSWGNDEKNVNLKFVVSR